LKQLEYLIRTRQIDDYLFWSWALTFFWLVELNHFFTLEP
jgi:hypothetical protein